MIICSRHVLAFFGGWCRNGYPGHHRSSADSWRNERWKISFWRWWWKKREREKDRRKKREGKGKWKKKSAKKVPVSKICVDQWKYFRRHPETTINSGSFKKIVGWRVGKGGGSGEGGRMERAVNVFHGKQRESLEEIEPECKDLNAMENWFLVRQITGFVVQTTRVRGLYWIW